MSDVKYLTKEQFAKLNERAIQRKANRTVEPKFIKRLSDGFKFPIIETLLHNDVEIALSDFDVLPSVDTGA